MKYAITYNTAHISFIRDDYNHNMSDVWKRTEEVEVGSVWQDTLGESVWATDGTGRELKRGEYKEVIITNKTSRID